MEIGSKNFSFLTALTNGPLRVFVIGGGNWGTVISRIAAQNAQRSYVFDNCVNLWLHEEYYQGESIVEVFNRKHENIKYLPSISLPENLVAVTNLLPYAEEADLIVFVIPHQFVDNITLQLKGHVKPTAQAISLLKGIKVEDGKPLLYSKVIEEGLGIPCSVMSGANVANDIAKGQYSETTLAYKPENRENAAIWQLLFDTPYYKVGGVPDICGVEVCGALKNIVALSVGFCDSLNYGTNTKSALIRIGVEEIKLFANLFFRDIQEETFFDSAGFADVITTCFGGRNVRCAAEFARRRGKDSWEKIEEEMLNGQKLQGQLTVKEIYNSIRVHNIEELFPLFTTTYKIAFEQAPIEDIIETFKSSQLHYLRTCEDCNACLTPKKLKKIQSTITTQHNIVPSD